MKKLFIVFLILSLFGCNKPQEELVTNEDMSNNTYYDSVVDIFDEYVPIMNTMVRLKITEGNNLYELSYKEMEKWHKLLDSNHYYRDDEDNLIHNLKIVNDSYGQDVAIEVSQDLIDVLDEAIQMMRLTEGYFNPFMGSVSELWKPKFSSFPIYNEDPTTDEITNALACTLSVEEVEDILVIDYQNKTIQFNKVDRCNGNVSINLGAFSKGYITEKVYNLLKENEGAWLLDAGNSTVVGYDTNQTHTWLVGTRSPYNKASSLFAIRLNSDEFLSTSGDDYQYFLIDNGDGTNTVRCHVINPYTGYSENYYRSVNVLTKSYGTISDVLSTALYSISDMKLAQKIIQAFEEEYNTEISVAYTVEVSQELKKVKVLVDEDFKSHILEDYITEAIESFEIIKE